MAIQPDYINAMLPSELTSAVFSYLSESVLGKCRQVCTKWRDIANDNGFLTSRGQPPEAFGGKGWYKMGKVTIDRRLPSNIRQILDSPCPIREGKTIKETHILFWNPTTVSGQNNTMNKMIGTLLPMISGQSNYNVLSSFILNSIGDVPNPTGKWLLLSKEPLLGTASLSLTEKMDHIKLLNDAGKTNYRMFTALEVTTACYVAHIQSNGQERLYKSSPTICQDRIIENVSFLGTCSFPVFVSFNQFGYTVDTCRDGQNEDDFAAGVVMEL